jgi:predicted Zn finger-like uncharacterized protein
MEIRCGSCNKLFRVSDDKITGKGIKFACTRCGEYVKITSEDFENYTLSQSTLSVLDMFEPKPKPSVAPAPGPEAAAVPGPAGTFEAAAAGNLPEEQPVAEPASLDLSAASEHDFLREREEPASSEPYPFEEPAAPAEPGPSPEQESRPSPVLEEPQPGTGNEENQDTLQQLPREAEPQPGVALQPEPQPAPLPEAQPAAAPQQKPEPPPAPPIETKRDLKPEPRPQPGPEPVSRPASEPKPISRPRQAAAAITIPAASPVAPAAPKKEPARPAAPSPPMAVIGASPAAPARSNAMILIVALLVLGLAGVGAYLYKRTPAPPAREPATNIMLTEGLHISNASGSLEPNGDLLISGAIENTSDKERAAWYIVVDVFDAQGTVMNKLKLLNGKQLYTRSDYDILAKRGVNTQELKTRALQQQGVVIPPKGSVSFEIRYLQPPVGVASFNSSLQPFDPERLFKEIAEEAK